VRKKDTLPLFLSGSVARALNAYGCRGAGILTIHGGLGLFVPCDPGVSGLRCNPRASKGDRKGVVM
jgi:hypothetical protein